MGLRFTRRQRLSKAREYQAAYAARCAGQAGPLRVYGRRNATSPAVARLGLAVGRRCGGAVVRNRIKRMVREAFRLEQGSIPAGLDVVVSVAPHRGLSLGEYRAMLLRGVGQAWERVQRRE
ncbi:MAG: ribonuclease P protein component, partial [Planctomyces sp.]|nr:ribonuclease P protein component [Planctomyces sp.]